MSAWASRVTRAVLALLMLTTLTCTKQGSGPAFTRAPRALIALMTVEGDVIEKKPALTSADKVAAKLERMEVVPFISPTQTKGPIIAAINGDVGPAKPPYKPYIRVWYTDAEGAHPPDQYSFGGPLFSDGYIATSEIHLPPGHKGYRLVFFNGCLSFSGAGDWKTVLGGTEGAPEFLAWTIDTPGCANKVGVKFGEGVDKYFAACESGSTPTVSIGVYVRDYIYKEMKKQYPDIVKNLKLF